MHESASRNLRLPSREQLEAKPPRLAVSYEACSWLTSAYNCFVQDLAHSVAGVQSNTLEAFSAVYRPLLGLWVAFISPSVIGQLQSDGALDLCRISQLLCARCGNAGLHPLVGNTLVSPSSHAHKRLKLGCEKCPVL